MVTLLTPQDGAIVSLQTTVQKAFWANSEEYAQNQNWRILVPEATTADMSVPNPVCFTWETSGEFEVFLLSDCADFSNILYRVSGCGSCEIYNLEIDRTYYWRVGDSEIRSFHTEYNVPRYILAEGARNIRDLGGYETCYGRRVKQGMIYRGSELNHHCSIKKEGVRRLREDLGIVYDLDLRMVDEGGYIYRSPLGADIRYTRLFTDCYIDYLESHAHSTFLMNFFAHNEKYPLYVHCAGGEDPTIMDTDIYPWDLHLTVGGYDRSSTVVFFLLAVLGVSDEDILREYEATSLAEVTPVSRHVPKANCKDIPNRDFWEDTSNVKLPPTVDIYDRAKAFFDIMLNHHYGKTIHESVCNYLRMCGVTDETMDIFREKMLEK